MLSLFDDAILPYIQGWPSLGYLLTNRRTTEAFEIVKLLLVIDSIRSLIARLCNTRENIWPQTREPERHWQVVPCLKYSCIALWFQNKDASIGDVTSYIVLCMFSNTKVLMLYNIWNTDVNALLVLFIHIYWFVFLGKPNYLQLNVFTLQRSKCLYFGLMFRIS